MQQRQARRRTCVFRADAAGQRSSGGRPSAAAADASATGVEGFVTLQSK